MIVGEGLDAGMRDGDSAKTTKRLDTLLTTWCDVNRVPVYEPGVRDLFAALKPCRRNNPRDPRADGA